MMAVGKAAESSGFDQFEAFAHVFRSAYTGCSAGPGGR